MALITGVTYLDYKLNFSTAPLIFALCASGLASPFLGVMWGLRGGQYSVVQHFGCFVIYVGAILGGMLALVVVL